MKFHMAVFVAGNDNNVLGSAFAADVVAFDFLLRRHVSSLA
jgi:hypothetical protein